MNQLPLLIISFIYLFFHKKIFLRAFYTIATSVTCWVMVEQINAIISLKMSALHSFFHNKRIFVKYMKWPRMMLSVAVSCDHRTRSEIFFFILVCSFWASVVQSKEHTNEMNFRYLNEIQLKFRHEFLFIFLDTHFFLIRCVSLRLSSAVREQIHVISVELDEKLVFFSLDQYPTLLLSSA